MYGAIGFFAVLGLGSPNTVGIVVTYVLILATIQLAAIWTVLGTGSFMARILRSISVAAIVISGFTLGVITMMFTRNFSSEVTGNVLAPILAIPALMMAAQLPFWVLRAGFGWQFVFGDDEPSLPFTLKELFAVTLFFAISLSCLQFSSFYSVERFSDYTQADSSLLPGEAEQAMVARKNRFRFELLLSQLIFAAMFSSVSLLLIPFLFLLFQAKDSLVGSIRCAALGGTLILLLAVIFSIADGGPIGLGGVFGIALNTFAFWLVAVIYPLAHTRSLGYSLTTPKRHERRQSLPPKV